MTEPEKKRGRKARKNQMQSKWIGFSVFVGGGLW